MRRTSSRRNIGSYPGQNRRGVIIDKKFQNRNVQICGYVYQNTNGLNHGPVWKIQSFLLSEICTFIQGLLWRRQFEKFLLKYGWEKVPNWECLFFNREIGLFLSVYVDDIKLAEKKQNIDPMWKVLMRDLVEPTSFLDHVYLGCTQRECQIGKDIVDNYRGMFESTYSAGATEKLLYSEKLELQLNNYTKSQRHAVTTTNSRKLENCQRFAHKLL